MGGRSLSLGEGERGAARPSQHRRAAIEQAVREDNVKKGGGSLGDKTIPVVLYVDGASTSRSRSLPT
jgi:hypothetical protein